MPCQMSGDRRATEATPLSGTSDPTTGCPARASWLIRFLKSSLDSVARRTSNRSPCDAVDDPAPGPIRTHATVDRAGGALAHSARRRLDKAIDRSFLVAAGHDRHPVARPRPPGAPSVGGPLNRRRPPLGHALAIAEPHPGPRGRRGARRRRTRPPAMSPSQLSFAAVAVLQDKDESARSRPAFARDLEGCESS